MIRCCRSRALDTGSWRDGSAIIRWSSWLTRGSSVTAMSDSLYQTLVQTGAPVGALGCNSRTLHGANGTGIGVSGCSHCVVSFMGPQTKFPILVCDLATGTDAIIGTDVLGSVLPHTLDIKNGLLFIEGVLHSSYTDGILLFPVVFLQGATTRYHLIQRLCCTVLYRLPVVVRCHPVVY